MALTCNINRDSEKKREPYTATQFMNFHETLQQEAPPPKPEVLSAQLTEMFRSLGKKNGTK